MNTRPQTVLLKDGYLHRVQSTDQEPCSDIERWTLVQVRHPDGSVQRHLLGRSDNEGRVTTALVELDLLGMQATTVSGRVYRLVGPPAEDADAQWIYRGWLAMGQRVQQKDLSRALVRLCRMRGRYGPTI